MFLINLYIAIESMAIEYSGILSGDNANGYELSRNTSRRKPPPKEVKTSQSKKIEANFVVFSAFFNP